MCYRPGLALALALSVLTVACATAPTGRQAPARAPASLDLSEQVVIRRTAYGVPHINAENLKAAGYGMGWVQVEDYGMDVVEGLVRARGEWSRHTGPEAVDGDALNRRWHARAVETYPLIDADTRAVLEGFAAGLNRYIELNPSSFPSWVRPAFDGRDIHALSITGASPRSARRFLERLERDRSGAAELAREGSSGDPTAIWRRLAAAAPEPHPDAGSNTWALAPGRTTSGRAILVRNPHLSWGAGYYEAHVTVPGVLDFYGDFRVGGPFGTIGGFNRFLGWSTTNNAPDLDEIYALAIDPERPDHYVLDGVSTPIQRETVLVEFRNGDGLGLESREILTTPFGPVIHRGDGMIHVLSTAYDGGFRAGEQFLRMMRATTLEEWKQAMRLRAHTSSNFTYADVDGNIFYVWNATIPVLPHASGGDTAAVAVTSRAEIASRLVPWDSLPQLLNPTGGYLRNENDEFHFTNLSALLDAGDFPAHYPAPRLRLRSQHSLQLIGTEEILSLEEVVERKHSMRMLLADRVKADLVAAVRAAGPEGEMADAIALIDAWDGTVARESRGGVLFRTWWWRYVETGEAAPGSPESSGFDATPESLFEVPWSPERPLDSPRGLADPERAVEAFRWAVAEAKRRHGGWDLPWGEVHRARIGDVDVPVGGCTGALGCFRVLWFVDHEEDPRRLQVRGGDGWVFAVEFGDVPRAYSVLAYGQSNQPASPHFNDQLRLFADNAMKTVAFTEADVRAATIREYRPGRR